MSKDSKKEYNWFVKFNLKPLNFWKILFYNLLWLNNYYPTKYVTYHRKDISKFISATKAKINYHYRHAFFATYRPYYDGTFSLRVKKWSYEIFLPFPELYQGSKELKQKYYYYTLFHELMHWTGSEFHLKRFSMSDPIKSSHLSHATEEVVAAFGCLFLMQKFSLDDDDVHERTLYYIRDYATEIVYQLSQLKLIQLKEGWNLNDYLKEEPVVYNYMAGVMLKARNAVEYLENLQK